eukprot:maker-scaffold422_size175911-snap-gene-0.37 protein:Tk09764 transcript:maker-scaffold422_size175911-snap-gene-0.37-mRNA-1 annotation:"cd63 antigen"
MSEMQDLSKYILFFINCITFICGVVLLFLGVYLHAQLSTYYDFMDSALYTFAVWCLILGVVVCLVSFLGLYGSIKEDHCALLAFAITLGIVICLELCLGVGAFAMAQEDRLVQSIAKKMKKSMRHYGEATEEEGTTKVWDILQTDFKCCGVEFPGDWSMTRWSRRNDQTDKLPASCCHALPLQSPYCRVSSPELHDLGCIVALERASKKNSGALGAVGCIVGLGQILLVVAAVRLMRGLKRPQNCPPCY